MAVISKAYSDKTLSWRNMLKIFMGFLISRYTSIFITERVQYLGKNAI